MIERSFERYLLLLIIVTLLSSLLVGLFSPTPASASMEQEEQDVLSMETWTQTTQADFESGDTTDLDTSSSPGEVMLDTYEFQVGAAESPSDYYWEGGWTRSSGRQDFEFERGGEIIEFTVVAGEYASAFKLKILRPTGEQNEFFAAETETFDPDPWTIKTWDLSDEPIPVQEDDRLGQYTLGALSSIAFTGEDGRYLYEGEITSDPQTMEWIDDDVITTMEAIVETHEDSGTLISSVHDTGPGMYDFGTISWSSDEPSGTGLTIETRTSPDGNSWSDWEEANDGGEVQSPVDRYIQYRASFQTSEGQNTPVLNEIDINYYVDTNPPDIELQQIEQWQGHGPYTIRATVTDEHSGVDENSIEIRYRIDGDVWQSTSMDPIGGDEYSGDIPDQAHGAEVDYHVYAKDVAENEETSREYSFYVDKDPPDSSISLEGEGPQNGWYRSEVEILFTAEDLHSGVDRIRYNVNGGSWGEIGGSEGSITVYDQGTNEVGFYAIDNVGNEENVEYKTFKIDDTKPESHISIDGPEGKGGWYTGGVEVTFNADDELSGIDYIEYRLNDEWQVIEGESGSITIDTEGETDLRYRAVDMAGNVEQDNVESIKIDATPPSVEFISPSPGGKNDWHVEEPVVTINAVDGISGISSISFRIINDTGEGDWQTVQNDEVEITLEDGEHTVEYLAENRAGLKSSEESEAGSSHIKVDTLKPEIDFTITEPEPSGWYTSPPEVSIFVDDRGGSRIELVQYRLGTDSDWTSYQGSFEIDKEGQFHLGLRVMDEAGNLNEIGEAEWLKIDMTSPSLNHVDTTDTVWNNEMTVTASIGSGESSLEKVILRYESDGGWKEKEMERSDGEYKATIPGDEVGFSDVNYRVIAEDVAGNQFESRTHVGYVGINWWYFIPIPIAVVLIGLFVHWKKRREEHEKLMPVKESKFSKIRQQKGQKLEDLKKNREERAPGISSISHSRYQSSSSPPPPSSGGAAAVAGMSSTYSPKSSYDRCRICKSPIDPDSELKCRCGKTYHNDCIMVEGNCIACGRDYAEVKSFTESGGLEEPPEEEPPRGELDDEEPDEEELENEVTKMLEDEPSPEAQDGIWLDTESEMTDQDKQDPKDAKETEEEVTKRCPVCNNKLEPGINKCWACGADLDEEK